MLFEIPEGMQFLDLNAVCLAMMCPYDTKISCSGCQFFLPEYKIDNYEQNDWERFIKVIRAYILLKAYKDIC